MFQELMTLSMNEKKGLTFFLKGGHSIAGIVTKINDQESVEAYSQQYDRILIPAVNILAVAL